jgi:hypothetical protein
MIGLSPTQRLEALRDDPALADSHQIIDELLSQYERFLETTNAAEDELITRFLDKAFSGEAMRDAYTFGDSVFKVLNSIGKENRFHRLLVV